MYIYRDFPLNEILYYKIGGKADFVLKIENKQDLLEAFRFVKKNKIKKILPVGLGANILASGKGFNGAVLWFSKEESSSSKPRMRLIGKDKIEVFASESLVDLISFSFDNNLIGFEWAGGLPSTIGGAVRGNAGAFGGKMQDNFVGAEVVYILGNGNIEIKELDRQRMNFSYRDSLVKEKKNIIIISCVFKFKKADDFEAKVAKEKYLSLIEYRKKRHPVEYPSCGSVFKNIREKDLIEKIIKVWPDVEKISKEKWFGKISMGYIIQRLGFSGFTIGGAKVSEKHGNYIVNFNKANFDNVFQIIEKIKEKFYQTFGFFPELEVEIVN